MPSLISQMRSGMWPQQPQQQQQQQQLNNSIQATKQLMQRVKMAQDKDAALAQIIASNPNCAALAQMVRGGNSLEDIAKSLAKQANIDINDVICQLGAM